MPISNSSIWNFIKKRLTSHFWEVLLVIMLLAAFSIFLITSPDFGMSYDEPLLYEYAERMADAYSKMAAGDSVGPLLEFYNLHYYGSAYLTLAYLGVGGLTKLVPGMELYQGWHIINFVTFLAGVWLVYILALRVVSKRYAVFSAMLFLTQPLLWGHGVMNPKDIPFMTAFLAVMAAGLKMADQAKSSGRNQPSGDHLKTLKIPQKLTVSVAFGSAMTVVLVLDRIFDNFLTKPLVRKILVGGLASAPDSIIGKFFGKLIDSANSLPLDNYLIKSLRVINQIETYLLLVIFLLGLTLILLKTTSFWRWLIIAGAFSGLALGVRVLGPAATGLVILYLSFQKPVNLVSRIFAILAVTLLVAYTAWPYLWGHPVTRLVESLMVMADFPWQGEVRFEGQDITASSLPWYYLPKLIGIQFTLPLLAGSLAGSVYFIKRIIQKQDGWQIAVIFMAWFWLPLAAIIAANPTMYDNFRQLLFITPPLFIMAGFAWEQLGQRIKLGFVHKALPVLLLVPGVAAGAWLHPYEYVYYNALVGWTANIERNYEADYWGTGLCEAAAAISAKTQEIELVVIQDQILSQLFSQCLDHPFDVRVERAEPSLLRPDYAVLLSRYNDDLDYFKNYEIDFLVQRGQTVFVIVKTPKSR